MHRVMEGDPGLGQISPETRRREFVVTSRSVLVGGGGNGYGKGR